MVYADHAEGTAVVVQRCTERHHGSADASADSIQGLRKLATGIVKRWPVQRTQGILVVAAGRGVTPVIAELRSPAAGRSDLSWTTFSFQTGGISRR